MTNEELIDAFVGEIIGNVFGDEGFSLETAARIKNEILQRMEGE